MADYVQNNFLSGVLDPRAKGRVETDAYNNGLLTGVNIVPVHLGGVRRRGGLRFAAKLSNVLTRVTSGVVVTAPNGGTTGNANDDVESTLVMTASNVGTTNPYIVLHYDLGAQTPVMAVDVMNILSTGGSSTEFFVQSSTDNVSWTTFGDADQNTNLDLVDTTARSYRRGFTNSNFPVIARYFRLVKIGGTDMGAVTITTSGMNVWIDSGVLSATRTIPFEVSTEEQYMAVFSDRAIGIYMAGEVVRLLPSPYLSADMAGIDASTNAETMVIAHENYAPRTLLRETVTNFQLDLLGIEGLPSYDFADSSSPTPVSDVQVITFGATWVQGDSFQLDLEGARTGPITYGGDTGAAQQATTAANIARAVQKLYTVGGFEGVSCARTNTREFTVTFAGASANSYELMTAIGLSATTPSAIAVTHSAVGTPRSEPAWSTTRGWPRTVVFFEGRLWFGGSRSLLQSLFGSEVNNILNFLTTQGLSDEPIFVTLNGAQLNAINGMFAGRSLQIFTSGGEFRFVKQLGVPIVPGDAPVLQTQYGSAKIRPVTIDGATLFVQRTGKAIRDFRFNFEEDAYDSLGVSSLAPHLINEVIDLAAWNGSREDEIGLTFVVNGDGTAAVFNSRKEASIQAWAQWTTEGLFKSVGVVFQDVYFVSQRTIAGVAGNYLEIVDDDCYTDCAVQTTQITNQGDGTALAGLGEFYPLTGQEVRVRADGFTLENKTVSVSGSIIIERPTAAFVEIGLNFNPTVTPMPINTITPSGPTFFDKCRIVKVWVMVRDTLGLRVNGRILADRAFDINSFDEAQAIPRSGKASIEESTNWDDDKDKLTIFDQVDPMPMEILAIKVKIGGKT